MHDIVPIKTAPIFLFEFEHGKDNYIIYRLSDEAYRFSIHSGNSYTVSSWKDEIRNITKGKVNYR